MKTRLIYIVLILILSAPLVIAQNSEKTNAAFGILGGVNFQNLNGKDYSGDKFTNDMIIGYHLGVNVMIPIVPQFYFQPGLMFSTKGAKYSDGSTARISYIELPLDAVYKALLGNGYFILGFGPYLGYAISTKGGDFKKFDAGGSIFVGYETAGGIFFQLDTEQGMINIYPDSGNSEDKSTIRNTGFGLSLGYRF
jgi:hypothetical protein